MTKTKSFFIALIVVGGCLFSAAILSSLLLDLPKIIVGVCFAIGISLLSIGIPKLIMKYCETAQPEMMKLNQIEFHDERNTMIRDKAKAMAGDISQYFIIGIAYVTIFVDAPRWMLFTLVGVFMLKNILEAVFSVVYQKKL